MVEDAESPASGVTLTGMLGVESPAVVWATTVTVYVVALVSPVIVQAVAVVVVHVSDPGDAVAVYPVTLPLSRDGAVQDTAALVSPGVTMTLSRWVRLGTGRTGTGQPVVLPSPSSP